MQKAIETHHISYNPEIKVKIPLELHHEIHETTPNKSKLSILMRQYDKLTKLLVMTKNWSSAFRKEFGDVLLVDLSQIESERRKIMKVIGGLITDELKKVSHIKGFGVRCLAGILAYANPQDFHCMTAFLYYCGFRGGKYHRYNRRVKASVWISVRSLIMAKDERYYSLYLKIKKRLVGEHPDFSKGKLDRMARNRVATLLLKEIYKLTVGERV